MRKKSPPIFKYSFLVTLLLLIQPPLHAQSAAKAAQKVVVIMMDGFGDDYYHSSNMPNLQAMAAKGIYKVVPGLMPSVTNVNNASIISGVPPRQNGITGNVFLNPATGQEEYMEDSSLLLAPTIFQRAARHGVKSILFSAKTKTVLLLNKGAGEAVSRETASPEWIKRLGTPPDVYSREINYWMMDAALYAMQHDSSLGLVYIHTTDYPMHTWAPGSAESKEHLNTIDQYLGKLQKTWPDAAILVTADHNVHHKNFCWDLDKACTNRGIPIKAAISPEKDRYFKHHLGMGGTAYIYLNDLKDSANVRKLILGLKGIDEVVSKAEAVKRFGLMPGRIGDLMVLADSLTVFGHLEHAESEPLPDSYRSHGSQYEAMVPLFVYNAKHAPKASYFKYNYMLASWLYKTRIF